MSTTNKRPTPETITLISQSDLMDVSLCCGQAHDGPTCPDGKVMCCLCFDRFEVSSLNVTEGGTPENVCKECAEMEGKAWRESAVVHAAPAHAPAPAHARDDSRRKMIDLEEHVAKLKLERSELWVEIAAAKHGDSGYAVLQERHEKQLEASPRQTPNIPQAMTTAQLDHLRAIEAHLDRLLAIAAKRTPGEWDASGSKNEIIASNEYGFLAKEEVCCSPKRNQFWPENATFIALCANNAEAGWRSAKAAIEALKFLSVRTCDESCPGGLPHASDVFIDSILAEWPLETLKP